MTTATAAEAAGRRRDGQSRTRRRRLWRMALDADAVAEAVAWRHASAKDVGMDEALQARQEEATTARMEAKSETAAERRRRLWRLHCVVRGRG